MKKLIILLVMLVTLQACRICCAKTPVKHYNTRNLSDR